jgi:phosphatidylethanolamine/phosphatidyl-N-methylethanolamine N-methyltransferase
MSLRDHLLLLGRFVREPRAIGAIAPSSAALARSMVDGLNLAGNVRVVELGPGTGAFTRAIVPRLGRSASMLAIDREPVFIERLQQHWPRVQSVCASAANLPALVAERGLLPVDHIVSGLPFASLPAEATKAILDGIDQTLRVGGTFTTFQYVHAYRMKAAVMFREEMNRRMAVEPRRLLVMWNLPPAYVLTWRRRDARTAPIGTTVA